VVLTQLNEQPLGRLPLPIVVLGAIWLHKGLGPQRHPCTPVGMEEGGPHHLLGRREGAMAVGPLSTRRTVHRLGGKRARASEGDKGVPLATHHRLQRFAAREDAQDRLEERPQLRRLDRSKDCAPRRSARPPLQTRAPRHLAFGSLLVKGQQRGRLEREQGQGGPEGIRQCHGRFAQALLGTGSKTGAPQADQGLGGSRLAPCGSTDRQHTLRRATSAMGRMRGPLWHRCLRQVQRDSSLNTGVETPPGIAIETARQAKEAARNLHESKQAEFAAACRAQQLKDDIEHEQQKKEEFDALLAQAERIKQNLKRFNSLNTAIPRLENVYTERARLAAVRQEELEYREALAALVEELSKLQEQRKQAECEYDAASGEQTAVNKRLTEIEARQGTLQQQAGQLKQIERLEARIQEAKVQLEPYRPILEAAANIEEEHGRQEALAQAVSLLQELDAASNALTQCKTQLTEAEKNQTEAGLALIYKQTAVKHAQVAVDEVLAQQDELQNIMMTHQEQSSLLRQKLEHRQALTGEEICPTCGSALDNDVVQARLASEREKWQIELDHLEQQIATLAEDLKLSKENLGKAKRTHLEVEQEAQTADKNLTAFSVKAEHAAQDVGWAQEAYDSACKAAGEWAEALSLLDTLETEFEHLKESSRWVALQEAQKVETQVAAGVTECRRILDELPQWTGEEREQLHANLEQVSVMVSECKEGAEAAKKLTAQIGKTLQKVQMQHTEKNAEKRSIESNLQASSQRVEKTKQEVTRLIDNLPERWRSHPAHQDEEEFQLLKAEWESLAEAPDRAENLWTAQREANVVQGAITALESQLEQIPQVLRRLVTEVEREEQGTREQLEKQEKRHEETFGALERLKQRRHHRAEFEEKRDRAAQECSHYERLARVFGQQGLQARVVPGCSRPDPPQCK